MTKSIDDALSLDRHVKAEVERLEHTMADEAPEVRILIAVALLASVAKHSDREHVQPVLDRVRTYLDDKVQQQAKRH